MYYTASGIITPVGGRPVHSPLSAYARDGHLESVKIAYAVYYNFDLLMMSIQCSKHLEAYNKLIIKQGFVY